MSIDGDLIDEIKKKKTISLVWTRKKDGRRTNPKKGSRMDPPLKDEKEVDPGAPR